MQYRSHDLPESQGEFALQIPDHGVEERGGQGAQQPLEQHPPEVWHVPADDELDHFALHGGHEYGHERAAHQGHRVHGQQAHLGRPKAGHHEPEQLLELDQELAVDARSGGSRPLAGRRSLAAAAAAYHGNGGDGRRPFGVVVVVGLARRSSRSAFGPFVALATVGDATAAHFQHDGVTDLAAAQQHGRGQHAFAHVVPADDPSVQVFRYNRGHGCGHDDDDGGGVGAGRGELTERRMSCLADEATSIIPTTSD